MNEKRRIFVCKATLAFSLIELMVVIAIISFIASIGVPKYIDYMEKAKQTEVMINLSSLHSAMQVYWTENNSYTTNLNGDGGVNWKPEGYSGGGKNENFYYTYGFNTSGGKEGIHFFTGKMLAPKSALGKTFADQNSFLAAAVGIKHNGSYDLWTINEKKQIRHISTHKSGVRKEWR